MDGNLSGSVDPTRFPQILIADDNFSTTESLIQTIADSQLGFNYDVCTSYDSAVIKLFRSPPPYRLIISSVHLAEKDNFLLVRHNRFLQPLVPFVVIAQASETESSRRALEQGAFDFIPTPLEHEQTVRTIRLALWHNQFKTLIASREKTLEKYLQHMADYPGDKVTDDAFKRTLLAVQKSVSTVERTFQQIDEGVVRLSDFASNMEEQARKRALARLDAVPR